MKKTLSLVLAMLLCLSCFAPALAEAKEPITIRVMAVTSPLTMNCDDMPVWQELQEKTGIDIEWDQIASGYEEKKAVALASPDAMPDVFFAGLTDADIAMNEGAFLDMTPYLDNCPNIQKMFAEMPDTRKLSISENGAIYSLPSIEPFCTNSYSVFMINKTWLDKLNLEVPTTFDELEQVLIAFRDGDPNGNGKKDEIPLDWNHGRGSLFSIFGLCGAYGVVEDHSGDMVTVKDGKVDFVWATEAYKNVQKYLGKLYSQGLINQEVFTQDYAGMMTKSKQGECAMVGVSLGWSTEDRMGQYSGEYIAMSPLKATADSTEEVLWPCNPTRIKMLTNRVMINANTEHPERIMELIDLLYSEYYTLQMTYGSIPNQITYDAANDTYDIVLPGEGENLDSRNWTNALVNNVPKYGSAALEAKTTQPAEGLSRLEQDKPYIPHMPKEIFPMVKFNAEDTEELTFIKTDLYKIVDEKMASWVVNNNVDEEWDAYIAQLENIGLNEMREIYQAAYDKYLAQ